MNEKINEYCSKIERKYDLKAKRKTHCPICKELGKPTEGNDLVWLHQVYHEDGRPEFHRWSYATGRPVEQSAESTNIL